MFNDYDMMLFDKVIAYDHLTQKISVIVNMKTDRVMENYGKAAADIQNIINIIRTAPAPEIPVSSSKVNFTCNVTQEEYCKLVEKQKNTSSMVIFSRQLFQDSSPLLTSAA